MVSARWVDTPLDRPRWRFTGNVRLAPWLMLGAEANPAAGEFTPLATVLLVAEDARRPAAFLGTSSDRIGSPEDTQSYYLTVAKRLPWAPVAPYASLNYSEWDEGWNVPFGANVDLGRGLSLTPMYDGRRSHLLAGWAGARAGVQFVWAWYERAGVSVSAGF